jgi:hypothetical protein
MLASYLSQTRLFRRKIERVDPIGIDVALRNIVAAHDDD